MISKAAWHNSYPGKKLIAYVSGPMSNRKHLNFPAFMRAAAALRARGYIVVNPAEAHYNKKHDKPWSYYLKKDLVAMFSCDIVVVLPGWKKSRGARLETYNARKLGIPIMEYTTGEFLS